MQAATASAISFAAGALQPLLVAIAVPGEVVPEIVGALSVVCLAIVGALGAKTGGAKVLNGAVRVTFWGAVAMAAMAGIGAPFGTHVGS